jgi:hypothetical protein
MATISLDLRFQIVFGIFGLLSLFIAVANLHPRDSLGAAWYWSIRSCFGVQRRRTPPEIDIELGDMPYRDDVKTAELFSVTSVEIPSPRLSLDENESVTKALTRTGLRRPRAPTITIDTRYISRYFHQHKGH